MVMSLDLPGAEAFRVSTFTPNQYLDPVERWRGEVYTQMPAALRKRPDADRLVDKFLYTMQGESGGDETVSHDGGTGYGLMGDRISRTPVGTDAKTQIRNAWKLVEANPDQWTDWGEGALYNGQPFGALGVAPYPGGGGQTYTAGPAAVGGAEQSNYVAPQSGNFANSVFAQDTGNVAGKVTGGIFARPETPENRVRRIASDLGGGGLGGLKDIVTSDIPALVKARDVIGDVLDTAVPYTGGAVKVSHYGPMGFINQSLDTAKAGAKLLGLPDVIPSGGEFMSSQIPTTALDTALTIGPGNIVKGAKGILGLGREAENVARIVPKNGKQLKNAMEESLKIAQQAYDEAIAAGKSVPEARKAMQAAVRDAASVTSFERSLENPTEATVARASQSTDPATQAWYREYLANQKAAKKAAELEARMKPADALSAEADALTTGQKPQGGGVVADIAGAAKKLGNPADLLTGAGESEQGITGGRRQQDKAATNRYVEQLKKGDASPPEAHWSPLRRAWEEVKGVAGLPRSVTTSFDVGGIARNDAVLGAGNPKAWAEAAAAQLDAFRSAGRAGEIKQAVESSPWYDKAVELGWKVYDWGEQAASRVPERSGVANASKIAGVLNKVPGFEGSERALALGRNVLGMRVIENEASRLLSSMSAADIAAGKLDEALKPIIEVVNHANGYSGTRLAKQLGPLGVFFSPEYTISRFQVVADPLVQALRGNPEAAKLAGKNLVSFLGTNALLMGMMALTGEGSGKWSVNFNPLSGDFGQLRLGATRFDTMAGFGPMIKTIARMGDAAKSGDFVALAQDFEKYFENKEQPLVKAFTDAAFHGRAPDWDSLKNMLLPMLVSGVWDALREGENPLIAGASAAASAVGIGTNTYQTAEDHADRIAQEQYGRKYDDLTPIERLKVVDSLPEEAQRAGRQAERQRFTERLTEAGYKAPSANTAKLDRDNPELDVQGWYWDKGPLHSPEAVKRALDADIADREVKFAGLKRPINQDENSKKAWAYSGKVMDWYLNQVVPDNAKTFIEYYARQKGGEAFKLKDGTLKTYDQLDAQAKSKVTSAIHDKAQDPETTAWLVWWGERQEPKDDRKVAAALDKITKEYGSKPYDVLKPAVVAGVKEAGR